MTPAPQYTFVLMELPPSTWPRSWRAFAIPQQSVAWPPAKKELVQIINLMFVADDEAAARAYVLKEYPNAKFFGDPP